MSVDEIRILEKARRDAMIAGDIVSLASLTDSEGWYYHGAGERQTINEWLRTVASRRFVYLDIGIEDEDVVMFSETAIVTGIMTLKVRVMDGQVQEMKRRIVDVWIRRAGRWRLAFYCGTLLDGG